MNSYRPTNEKAARDILIGIPGSPWSAEPSPLRRTLRKAMVRLEAAIFALLGYEQEPPREPDRIVLPLSSGVNILPNTSAQITARPQTMAFRPERIIIENAEHWVVNDIKVGNRSQFSQSGDVPGGAFSADARENHLSLETVQTAMDFVILVTYVGPNPDGEPLLACVFGTAVTW